MTDIKFEILKALYCSDTGTVLYVDLLNNIENGIEVKKALKNLQQAYKPPLIIKCIGKRAFEITEKGRLAYENEYERRKRNSNNEHTPANKNSLDKTANRSKFLSYLEQHLPLFARLAIKIIDLFPKT